MKCYAAYAKDENIRKLGSSGAFFPLLSTAYIRQGGIVYASIYDEQLNVKFARIEDEAHLHASFTAKYVQSQVGDTFCHLEKDLKEGRKVLFCGTPCQAAGLRQYLGRKRVNYDRLLIAENICHGVPSPDVYQMAMKHCHPNCISLNMRNKDYGWEWGGYAWKMVLDDGTEQIIPQSEVPYMKGFLTNICLRPSCYQCAAKNSKAADITLGDFWGISFVNNKIPARYGVSAVILRTQAAEDAFAEIQQDLECYEVNYTDILTYNSCLEMSISKPIYRDRFFKKLLSDPDADIATLLTVASDPSFLSKVVNKLYKMLPHWGTPVHDLTSKEQRVLYGTKEQCCGCSACYSICPKDAISMKKDREGFLYAVIDEMKCVNCGACTAVCPFVKK